MPKGTISQVSSQLPVSASKYSRLSCIRRGPVTLSYKMKSSRSQQILQEDESELTDKLDGKICETSQVAVPDSVQRECGHCCCRTCPHQPAKQATAESEGISRCLLDRQASDEDQTTECQCEDCSTEHQKQFTEDNCPPRLQVCEDCNDQVQTTDMDPETYTTDGCLKPQIKCPFVDTGPGCAFQDMEEEMEIHLSGNYQEHLLLAQKEMSSIKQDLCSLKQELSEVRGLEENLQQLDKDAKEQNETLAILRSKVTEQDETIERIHNEQNTRMEAAEEKIQLVSEAEDYKSNGLVHGSVAPWNKNSKEDLEMSLLETFQRLDRLERENKELKTTLDVINRGLSTVQKDYRGLTVTMVQHREELGALDRRTSYLGESKSEPCLASGDSGWRRFRRRFVRLFQRPRRGEGWMNENLQK